MSKEVDKRICEACDSEYKLVYDLTSTSGFPKFCPFCSEPITEKEEDEMDLDE